MINLDDLERLAKAAIARGEEIGEESWYSEEEFVCNMLMHPDDAKFSEAANPTVILELVAEARRLREERRQALLDAERNRVGVEIRREWMSKCEALRIERDALFTACRNAILPLAYVAQRDPTYQREYESLSAVIDCARAKDQP